jgi:flagellar hook-associated protein 2
MIIKTLIERWKIVIRSTLNFSLFCRYKCRVEAVSMTSPFRMVGIGSGMDIDSMVEKLMTARRIPLDTLKQKKQTYEWQQNAYRDVNKKINTFKDNASSILTSSALQQKKVTTSNASMVTATSTAAAVNTSYTIKVNNLATATSVSSVDDASINGTLSDNTAAHKNGSVTFSVDPIMNVPLASAGFPQTLKDGSVTINGQVFTIDADKTTIDGLIGQINTNKAAGVKLSYNAAQKRFELQSTKVGSNASISLSASGTNFLDAVGFDTSTTYGSGTINVSKPLSQVAADIGLTTNSSGVFSFKINSVPFTFDADSDSLTDVINTINASSAGVTAYYDQDADRFFLTAKDTGSGSIDRQDTYGSNFLTAMKVLGVNSNENLGRNASFNINGQEISSASNSYTMAGTTFNLVGSDTNTTTTITVSPDVDKIYDTIKSFVDSYNETIDFINTKLTEDKYRDFPPLTDAQKKEMKDDEIKQWEEKAKSGILKNESYLRSALSQMRQYATLPVNTLTNRYTQFSQIGITTGKVGSSVEVAKSAGKLQIDETTLKNAIAADQDAVSRLFTYEKTDSTNYNDMGIARRMKSYMGDIDRYIRDKAGADGTTGISSIIGQRLHDLNTDISELEDKMVDIEDQYYKKFNAMEQAINRMNEQSNYLAQQFSNTSN